MEKRKKPSFLRTEWNKKPRLGSSKNTKWRRARGRHSKIRQKMKGNTKAPSIGYGMPREIRGLVNGMKPVVLQNVGDLDKVGKNEVAVVSSTLGMKKKVMLAEKASKMKVNFLNFNPQKVLSAVKEAAEKKAKKSEAKEKKDKESKEAKKEETAKTEAAKKAEGENR